MRPFVLFAVVFLAFSAVVSAAPNIDGTSAPPAPQAAAGSAAASSLSRASDQNVALKYAKGSVFTQQPGGQWIPVRKGARLGPKDKLKTGLDGSALIHIDGKARITLSPESQISVELALRDGPDRRTQILVDLGRIKADVDRLKGGSKFELRSPTAVASVRGTILYFSVDAAANQQTDLYVDNGLVHFFPTNDPDAGSLVDQFGLTSISGGGTMPDIQHLSPEERRVFIDRFEQAIQNAGNPQGEAEETSGDASEDIDLADVSEDQSSRNNLSSVAGPDPALLALKAAGLLLSEGVPDSGDFNHNFVSSTFSDVGIVSGDRIEPRSALLGSSTLGEGRPRFADLVELRRKEREEIREIMKDLIGDQQFNLVQAQIEQTNDRQTGKVFTDVHGNRVRTDQYIFQPNASSVQVVALTLRTAGPHKGVSALIWGADFKNPIEGSFRGLPWDDYSNVVSEHEMENALDGEYDLPGEIRDSDQFIVHEHAAGSAEPPSNYPTRFFADFRNPNQDRILFEESYSDPLLVNFGLAQNDRIWVQGQTNDATSIFLKGSTTPLNLQPVGNNDDDDGSQTGILNPMHFGDVNNFKFDKNESPHPAFFDDDFVLGQGSERQNKKLIGLFVPIDNDGNILYPNPVPGSGLDEGEGFAIKGIRDLLSPNPLIHNGNYNLEVILLFGHHAEKNERDSFVPEFTIDVIITPELLKHHGMVNDSLRFPPSLIDSEDDDGR